MYKRFGEMYLKTYKAIIKKEYNEELKYISREIQQDLNRANDAYNKGMKDIEDMTR